METLLLFSAGGSMCTDVPVGGPGCWWVQKFTLDRQDSTRNCPLSALHPLLPSLPVLPGHPRFCKDNLDQAQTVMYPVTPRRLMLFTPSDRPGKCAWLGTDTFHRD